MPELILPGHPEFNAWLTTAPTDWVDVAAKHDGAIFATRLDSHCFDTLNFSEFLEYVNGGEYDAVCEAQGMVWDDELEDWFEPEELDYINTVDNNECPGEYWLPYQLEPTGCIQVALPLPE